MVQLDHALVRRARALITGSNVHRMKEVIFVYEQAVLLHNKGWPTHIRYQHQHETELRQFVASELSRLLGDKCVLAERFPRPSGASHA
jgi:hypothetical protein